MDPATLTTIKLAHHAHDQSHEHDHGHKLNPQTDSIQNPITYGLSSMPKPAFWMGLSLAAFSGVLKLSASILAYFGFPGVDLALTAVTGGSELAGFAVAGLAGAIWGGGMGFYKGYTHATEHNARLERLQQGIDDPEHARGNGKGKTIETALENAPRKGVVVMGTSNSMTPIGIVMQTDEPAPAMAAPTNEPARARPQWMQEILDRGPRSATAPDQTVALSSQNGR